MFKNCKNITFKKLYLTSIILLGSITLLETNQNFDIHIFIKCII